MDNSKRMLVLVILMSFVVIVSGCFGTKEENIPKQAAFLGGTDGLAVSLLQGQPPSTVFPGQQFQIGVTIENKGEGSLRPITPVIASFPSEGGPPGDIPDAFYGYVSIAGIDTSSFKTDAFKPLTVDLPSAKKIGGSRVPGGQTQIIFSATAPQRFTQEFPLQAVLLYTYVSKAVSAVCLKEDIYQQAIGGQEICKLTGSKPVESAGAPIRVTSVEELPTGFNIKVRNVDSGYPFIFKVGSDFPKSEGEVDRFNQKDRIRLYSVKLGDAEIVQECSVSEDTNYGGKVLFLVNNEATFFCQANLGVGSEFVEQLTIEMEYGYVDRALTKLQVQSV